MHLRVGTSSVYRSRHILNSYGRPVDKSQLRRLARDYAIGDLEHEDYLRRRTQLIDEIVSGRSSIERDAPITRLGGELASLRQSFKSSPLQVLIGACVVVAIFLALYATRQPPESRSVTEQAPPALTGKRIPAARALVEDFLKARDWSAESLGEFKASWNALTPNEQAEARTSAWFSRLSEALRAEINAHKALAEFDGTGAATTTGRRLASFGEFLGIGDELPGISVSGDEPVAAMGAELHGAGGETVGVGAPRLTAWQWLKAQNENDLTLQLYAVNHLDQLERLIARHPELELRLLVFEARQPRYRLIFGAFPSEAEARRAHASLPSGLTAERPEPFIRRITELREERRSEPMDEAAVEPATRLSASSSPYTLQLVASESRDNAERLVARYDSLDLRIHTSEGEVPRYRVLYGHFPSAEAAREASASLPQPMLEEVGKPLVKSEAEFR